MRIERYIDRLVGTGDLPSAEAVATSRATRDTLVSEVRRRLARERRADDVGAADDLGTAIHAADALADRRDADAARVAEHSIASAELAKATALKLSAEVRRKAAAGALAEIQAKWADELRPLGFEATLPPSGMTAWRTERERCLAALGEAKTADVALARQRETLTGLTTALSRALRALDVQTTADSIDDLTTVARVAMKKLEDDVKTAALHEAQRHALASAAEDLTREETRLAAAQRAATELSARLVEEGGLPVDSGDAALMDAVAALEAIGEHIGARAGLARQAGGMERDIAAFDREVVALLATLSRPAGISTTVVRNLALELRIAASSDEELLRQRRLTAEATEALEQVANDAAAAELVIGELMGSAGVTTVTELGV